MSTPTRPFSLLVKPASADCNLRCEYCFYLPKSRLYPATPRHRMTDAVLEQLIRSYLATEQPVYSIGWQGGEPTLMGLDFFQRVTDLEQRHGRAGATVANGLQTNATRLDDDLARHFSHYRFLLGCSLDGPAEIHDRYRRDPAGAGSHADVLRGIATLQRWQVEFNILCLVSQANVRRARQVYRYLTDHGFLFHQYIPCVEFDAAGRPQPFAITGEEWGGFLCELFDEWARADVGHVSVRHFDALVNKLVDGEVTVCTLGRTCCQYLLVEHNGDIYPCDFFVEPALRLGNVADTSWHRALTSRVYREFGAQKTRWNAACAACVHVDLCRGDCLKHRLHGGATSANLSWLCAGWKRFFGHARPRLEELAREVQTRRALESRQSPPSVGTRTVAAPPERNAPCPCGSGRKFKKCCGR